jgi:D-beta-D-heptose 7-phosphate kinase/D-beta-D-heptose 1-phosphate adenosyltransferase
LSRAKVKSLASLKKIISSLQKKGKKVVFTNGCFDILHYGHVMYLQAARKKGDCLVVAVNSDASVKRIKGAKRPLVGEIDRANIIAALESVDFVLIFHQDTPLEVIKNLKPDILVKGADWKDKIIVGAEIVKKNNGKVVTIKLAGGRSTTNIIKKIIETCKK